MCFGGSSPKAPEVVYTGPSQDQIDANEEKLEAYETQMAKQQKQFQNQLQAQIDQANKDMKGLEKEFAKQIKGAKGKAKAAEGKAAQDLENIKDQSAKDLAAAAATGAAYQGSSGVVTVSESEPVGVQETKEIKDKKKPNSNLKIAQNSVEASSGAGLNIGV